MKGRPAKPTALKIVEGNKGKRSLAKQEPDPDYLEDLSPPSWLPEDAKTVWNEEAPKARRAKLLTEVDVMLFSMLCCAMADYRKATKLSDRGILVKGKDESAQPMINPALIVKSMAFKQVAVLASRFGFSPADRTRIAVNPQGDLFGNGDKDSKTAGYFA